MLESVKQESDTGKLMLNWYDTIWPSVLWRCWLDGRKGIRPVKNMGGWCRWALVSPDGVTTSRMVGVSASVNLPLHHKVQKFSSETGSPGWCQKKGRKTVVCVYVCVCDMTRYDTPRQWKQNVC